MSQAISQSSGSHLEARNFDSSQKCSVADRIHTIRDGVLDLIRNKMPITTLFTPELRVDLALFINDQVFFRRIAECIAPLMGQEVDIALMAQHFEGSGLASEVKALFKQDADLYLSHLYSACVDVLSGRFSSEDLKPAIEGRIYTLKNALIALHNPKAIRTSQLQNKIAAQDVASIQKEGQEFIRECLYLHLDALGKTEMGSFQEHLTSVAKQLIPFVQKVTKSYLDENRKTCSENPLTFRDRTGHNHHGLVAATVMEVCLQALGFKSRVLVRSDLEPKVTLATAHSIVEVRGDEGTKYIVDPCYLQFHKDICLEDDQLPDAPVLVLAEDQLDGYVESQMMPVWKSNYEKYTREDQETIRKLCEMDQILPFMIDQTHLDKIFLPDDKERWVKESLVRVWDNKSYCSAFANMGFQDIFAGGRRGYRSFEMIKPMGLSSLTNYLKDDEIEGRLNAMLKSSELRGQNSPAAMSLIPWLAASKREKYGALLDTDPRLQEVDITLNAYFRSLRKVVNPEGRDLSVIYGCSGGDCSSVLLATDANDLTFIDMTKVAPGNTQQALDLLLDNGFAEQIEVMQLLQKDSYNGNHYRYLGSMSYYLNDGRHHMDHLPLKLLTDLKYLGVSLDEIVISESEKGIHIDFPWKYHGAEQTRMRRITYVSADLTKPDLYPESLKRKLEAGFDVFYMKGAFFVPKAYKDFLPQLVSAMRPGGWVMTTERTWTMEKVTPDACLEESGFTFKSEKSEETHNLEELLEPPFDPLNGIPTLERHPAEMRHYRFPGTNLLYWSILNLRQKV